MAMTAAVKDELSRVDVSEALLPAGGDGGAAAVRRRAAHRLRPGRGRGRAGHRRRRPPAAPGDRRGVRVPQRGARARLRRACARAATTSSGSSRTARRWPGRPACSTSAAARCAACPRTWCRPRLLRGGRLARRVPGARLAHRAGPVLRPGGHLPRPGGRARAGRRGPADRHHRQGARGARRGPGGDQGRRRDRRAAHPDRRARQRAGLGGAADAPGGAGHREPAGQLRRRQPAPLGPRRGGRRPPGSPARWRSSATRRRTT